mgnify:FL=1
MKKNETVLVAMSGGVDSAVALLKIIEMGYKAIGVTMKLWEYNNVGGNVLKENNCCAIESINNAKLVCERLEVPHYTIDFTEDFENKVINNFVDEYLSGRTPNPCVRCNSYVKWDTFINQADKLGAKYIATGHYANIEKNNNEYKITRGKDKGKDQSYVLWGIPKETLSRTILPLGNLRKREVRQIAADNKFENAQAPESMEICFIPDNNYKRFINEYAKDKVEEISKKGTTLNEDGEKIGENDGFINYTVGQRKGIGITNPNPLYVKKISSDKNSITVSEKKSLFSKECKVSNINWLNNKITLPLNAYAQIRYNGQISESKISDNDGSIFVTFEKPQLAVTPGQSIVFYDEKESLLGGGIIELYES